MEKVLKKFRGKNVRLYTVSGVESYIGVLQDANKECVTLKDSAHGEVMYIATQYVESFHESKVAEM